MTKKIISALFLILLTGCALRTAKNDPNQITSLQMVDRNGFSETIGNKERLGVYQNVDFLSTQPYQKVLRVFGRDNEGKSHSKITSYHPNGGVWQYLEVLDGRAHGQFKEWHENGTLKISCIVLDGMADVTPLAQNGWIFDGQSLVWDENGVLIADIQYDNGVLQGISSYYYPTGKLWKIIPYDHHLIHGEVLVYNQNGEVIEKIPYEKGLKNGIASGIWSEGNPWYEEDHETGLLKKAIYYDPSGKKMAEVISGDGLQAQFENQRLYSLIQYQKGKVEGEIKIFDKTGLLFNSYCIKDDKKQGEEWEYYPNSSQPKLLVSWYEDCIQGLVKTWYENGNLESQREMSNNKKHGLSFAYYKDGQLMFMEEYDNDKLWRGSYFKKGEKIPISKIEEGFGIATLYNHDGYLIQKVTYEKGLPIIE
ncbi:MAG TPA: hypothetical protein VLG76_00595 [Rhabdochlamydiaceae bacterium]|nr:hypothetical protein [Rhabdochlamydiaceae bacterium]